MDGTDVDDGDGEIAAAADVFLIGAQQGAVTVRQPARGYRAGIDAVFLAAVCDSSETGPILDVGAGAGTVGLCAAARCQGARVVMVERQPQLVSLACLNIEANRLKERTSVIEADILAGPSISAQPALASEHFTLVLANPPYHDSDAGTAAGNALKAASHAMPHYELEGWARFMARMAAPGGRAVMTHKAEALGRVLAIFEGRFGALRVLPLRPTAGAPANRILVSGIKGSRAPLVLLDGFNMHTSDGAFTAEAEAILRYGASLRI